MIHLELMWLGELARRLDRRIFVREGRLTMIVEGIVDFNIPIHSGWPPGGPLVIVERQAQLVLDIRESKGSVGPGIGSVDQAASMSILCPPPETVLGLVGDERKEQHRMGSSEVAVPSPKADEASFDGSCA